MSQPDCPVCRQLADALQDARETLAVAIEAGLEGFSPEDVRAILKSHVTMRRIDEALKAAKQE
jgi:predicted RNase H-like HicB family nuclease